ncbi:hypothetical protein BS50DRAFT_579847 [Corynespora cassiicola Philippines]|uniref:Zn(2)-C6 fungal-type domain-containing protein n=1 Tax=Corynespora cassiicola Philippines TaxID=1448308 RepID=A0A2T2N2D8_CORCC|nr:hypothetical protein BS50DRAFT_579847 [Corynespora cassiicola Philippines]
MPESRTQGSKRPRGAYSRLICLGCRDRRIRCELPSEVEVPGLGELRAVQTPCHRCKRLGLPCMVRQTILGRPSSKSGSTTALKIPPLRADDIVSRIVIDLSFRTTGPTTSSNSQQEPRLINNSVISHTGLHSPNDFLPSKRDPARWNGGTLLIHKPQSAETILIIRAVDTLRREKVEEEWFRHLPAHVGHTRALDLSIKALVAACAYARSAPRLTSSDCYQALALALDAVQVEMKQSRGQLGDDVLASTALLAPFEGVVKKHGIPTRLHVKGLAAILAARHTTFPVTQLARDVFDFHACDSAVISCIQGTPSPFENVARGYYSNNRVGCSDDDRAQLKALGSELFIRIPRLVSLARSLRSQPFLQDHLIVPALSLLKSLLRLQDSDAEERLLRNTGIRSSGDLDATSSFLRNLHFASVHDFEALAYYWQNRLSLLRLEQHLQQLVVRSIRGTDDTDQLRSFTKPSTGQSSDEMLRLVNNILMSIEYAKALPLRKHERLLAHAMVIVWGVQMDMPATPFRAQDGGEMGSLYRLLLQTTNFALPTNPNLTFEDMDIAANIFVGGQPKGRFAKLYTT